MNKLITALAAGVAMGAASAADATTLTADVVIDFFDSGNGPIAGPYGGVANGQQNVPVGFENVTDGDADTFISLPEGTFITLGFSGGSVFDGDGDDIFVSEFGNANENAEVLVSADGGVTFTLLGIADGGDLSSFDLADIGFQGIVNAVRILSLNTRGSAPGFDLAFVQGLEGSVVVADPVPLPGAAVFLLTALAGGGIARRRIARI